MSQLEIQFGILARDLVELLALLDEAGDTFWKPYFECGLRQVREHKLAGATFVLGCFGGEATFSDLVIGRQWATTEPLRFGNLNARLGELRNRVFDSANAITARRAW